MEKIFVILVVIIVVTVFVKIIRGREDKQRGYKYKRRDFFMSRAEHECYDTLMVAIGQKYYVFPQVHLPTLVDSRVIGQNWHGAFRHISEKSVDFVLCDKAYISPKLVIELDDHSHGRPDRKERDAEVERICKNADLPLLRLENRGRFNPDELTQKINDILK